MLTSDLILLNANTNIKFKKYISEIIYYSTKKAQIIYLFKIKVN